MQTHKGSRIMVTDGMLHMFARDFHTDNHNCKTFNQYVEKRLKGIVDALHN